MPSCLIGQNKLAIDIKSSREARIYAAVHAKIHVSSLCGPVWHPQQILCTEYDDAWITLMRRFFELLYQQDLLLLWRPMPRFELRSVHKALFRHY